MAVALGKLVFLPQVVERGGQDGTGVAQRLGGADGAKTEQNREGLRPAGLSFALTGTTAIVVCREIVARARQGAHQRLSPRLRLPATIHRPRAA